MCLLQDASRFLPGVRRYLLTGPETLHAVSPEMLADSLLTDGGTTPCALCERSLESEAGEAKPPIQSRLSQESKELGAKRVLSCS
jgi:hypothetical protein